MSDRILKEEIDELVDSIILYEISSSLVQKTFNRAQDAIAVHNNVKDREFVKKKKLLIKTKLLSMKNRRKPNV